jgi:ribosomal protein S18 acetylase RimI-like enzyme
MEGTCMNIIRKAKLKDIDAVALIFEHIIEEEEKGKCNTGWQRGIYPTRNTAAAALENDDLFVMEEDGAIVAAMRLNKEQVPEYKNCQWEYTAVDDQVMVMHTLVVEPYVKKHGYGRQMVEFYEKYAKENNCPYLRIDTNALNTRARAMYKNNGYKEIGITPCVFNGMMGVNLVCIEKKLDL